MSRRTTLALALLLALLGTAQAQQKSAHKPRSSEPTLTDLTPAPTPEMWFYMHQLQRYDDPKHAVRRNAEFRADQRHARIAATRWYGVDNLRPVVSSLPQMGTYAPQYPRGVGAGFGVSPWGGEQREFSSHIDRPFVMNDPESTAQRKGRSMAAVERKENRTQLARTNETAKK